MSAIILASVLGGAGAMHSMRSRDPMARMDAEVRAANRVASQSCRFNKNSGGCRAMRQVFDQKLGIHLRAQQFVRELGMSPQNARNAATLESLHPKHQSVQNAYTHLNAARKANDTARRAELRAIYLQSQAQLQLQRLERAARNGEVHKRRGSIAGKAAGRVLTKGR